MTNDTSGAERPSGRRFRIRETPAELTRAAYGAASQVRPDLRAIYAYGWLASAVASTTHYYTSAQLAALVRGLNRAIEAGTEEGTIR